MSISQSLSNAVSGMTATARMAEVVSSNLANSLTDGYGRRTLNLSAAALSGHGGGVEIGGVTRHVDRAILSDRRLADANLSGFEVLVSNMEKIEETIGRNGETGSISSRIVAVEAALVDAASDPSSSVRLASLGDHLQSLAHSLNDASDRLQTLRAEADTSIADQVDQLNRGLAQVEQLNIDITRHQAAGHDPSGLIDQRQQIIDQISQIVPVKEIDREAGQVALMTLDGMLLLDGKAKQFEFLQNHIITPDMTLASGGLFGITVGGDPVGVDGFGKLAGGSLSATFQMRDQELVVAQAGLDDIAADVISRVQDPNVDSTLAVGQPGLMTDNGVAFDSANITGLAGRISLNAAVDPNRGGTPTKLRDGINAATPGLSGTADLLHALSAAFSSPRNSANDPTFQSASGRAASFEAAVGSQRLSFESELSFASSRWASLKEAEAAEGVDSDYEMQMLLRIEQAYAANARVIQAVDSMMQQLMEI